MSSSGTLWFLQVLLKRAVLGLQHVVLHANGSLAGMALLRMEVQQATHLLGMITL